MSAILPILPPAPTEPDTLTPAALAAEEEKNRMRRYFEKPDDELAARVAHEPVCLYLETTNRCNLLCTTCPAPMSSLSPRRTCPGISSPR